MPPLYAVVSFCSYRFIRDYLYFDLGEAGESRLVFTKGQPPHFFE